MLLKEFPAAAKRMGLSPRTITIDIFRKGLFGQNTIEKEGWTLFSYDDNVSVVMYTDCTCQVVHGAWRDCYSKYFTLEMAATKFYNISVTGQALKSILESALSGAPVSLWENSTFVGFDYEYKCKRYEKDLYSFLV